MTDFFENLEKLELQDVLDRHLKIQVDAPWPTEAEHLESCGLKDAHRILDIGTGNGHFLLRLAQRHPEKEFVGVEVSEPLAAAARKAFDENGPSNVEIVNDRGKELAIIKCCKP
jgi:tRNA G46 methylase TrmB